MVGFVDLQFVKTTHMVFGGGRREEGEQAGGSPHYLQEQIHNKFPHSTKPGRDD